MLFLLLLALHALAQPLPGALWPQEGYTAQKGGAAPAGPWPGAAPLVAWSFPAPIGGAIPTGSTPSGPVVDAQGNIYVGSDASDAAGNGSGVLYKLSPSGRELWRATFAPGTGALAVPALTAGGLVLVSAGSGGAAASLRGINASSGAVVWSQAWAGYNTVPVLDAAGRVFVGRPPGYPASLRPRHQPALLRGSVLR